MKKYDINYYRSILKLIDNDEYKKAKIFLEEYLKKYPTDEVALFKYAFLLRKMDYLEEALKIIDKLKKDIDEVKCEKMFILYKLENYEEAYKLIQELEKENSKLINRYTFKATKIFILKKLNIIEESVVRENEPYKIRQIIEYSLEEALNHISEHLYSNIEAKNEFHNLFEKEIDVNKLYFMIQDKLKDALLYQRENITDIYIFKYPNLNDDIDYKNENYKYLRVITIRETSDIITIYPIFSNVKIKEANDINTKLEVEHIKTKKKSAIEKFNQKYANYLK